MTKKRLSSEVFCTVPTAVSYTHLAQARQKAYAAINSAMVDAYWQMGKRIVEQEQFGKERADYGAQLLKSLSKELTAEFGKGFSVGSLYYYRQFYLIFPEIFATPWRILTWSHYKRLDVYKRQLHHC